MFPFMHMIAGCSMAIAIAYGGYIAILGQISVGDFSAFIQYLNMLVWPVASIGRIINVVTRGSASLKRVEAVLQTKSDIPDLLPAGEEESLCGDIRAENLTFRYPGTDQDVLRNVSFHVKLRADARYRGPHGGWQNNACEPPCACGRSCAGHDLDRRPGNSRRFTENASPHGGLCDAG